MSYNLFTSIGSHRKHAKKNVFQTSIKLSITSPKFNLFFQKFDLNMLQIWWTFGQAFDEIFLHVFCDSHIYLISIIKKYSPPSFLLCHQRRSQCWIERCLPIVHQFIIGKLKIKECILKTISSSIAIVYSTIDPTGNRLILIEDLLKIRNNLL